MQLSQLAALEEVIADSESKAQHKKNEIVEKQKEIDRKIRECEENMVKWTETDLVGHLNMLNIVFSQ